MIELALRLRVVWGHPGAKRMYVRTIYTCIYYIYILYKYTNRGSLSSYKPGLLPLTQLLYLYTHSKVHFFYICVFLLKLKIVNSALISSVSGWRDEADGRDRAGRTTGGVHQSEMGDCKEQWMVTG